MNKPAREIFHNLVIQKWFLLVAYNLSLNYLLTSNKPFRVVLRKSCSKRNTTVAFQIAQKSVCNCGAQIRRSNNIWENSEAASCLGKSQWGNDYIHSDAMITLALFINFYIHISLLYSLFFNVFKATLPSHSWSRAPLGKGCSSAGGGDRLVPQDGRTY